MRQAGPPGPGEGAVLENLRRERYLIVRSLRVALAMLETLDAGGPTLSADLERLLRFLQGFVVEHHFPRTERLLARLAATASPPRKVPPSMSLDHRLVQDLVETVTGELEGGAPWPGRIREPLDGLVRILSQVLLRDDDRFDALQDPNRTDPGSDEREAHGGDAPAHHVPALLELEERYLSG